MTTKIITLGFVLLTGFIGFSQEESEQERECKRARFLAGEALKVNNYPEATLYYIKGEKICGGYDIDNYNRLIGSLQYTINEEADAKRRSAYIDTIVHFYDKIDSLGIFDAKYSMTRALYMLQSSKPNAKKIDSLMVKGIAIEGTKLNESYLLYYYTNLYNIYAASSGADKAAYKKRIISEYFVWSKLVVDANMSSKTQESLTQIFNALVNTCADLLPELKDFMKSFPQDLEQKKTAVNNFIALMEEKNCTDAKEYEMLIDTLIKIDPSVGAVIAKAKLLKVKKRYSEAIETFKSAKNMSTDGVQKEELEYEILVIQYENLNSYKTAYNTAMGINGSNKSDALKIAASCVMKLANGCGNTSFERKCNYYYAEELANRAGAGNLAAQARGNFPTAEDIFNEGKAKGQSMFLTCWNVSVTIK